MAMQKYGIIGHPIAHSLSPAMQGAAFRALGIDAEYKTYDIEPAQVDGFLHDAAGKGFAGFNVTVPHKIAAKDYIERFGELDDNAKRLGAVNTVKIVDGRLRGYNTDGPGFYRSLIKDLKFEPEGKNIFLLGAGGAARAIAMYLGASPNTLFVNDIDERKLNDLKAHYAQYYDAKKLVLVKKDQVALALRESHLLVNATPIGMHVSDPLPIDGRLLHPGLFVYDLVYNRQSALVKEATMKKLHASTGLGMLLYQGAIACEVWTGKPAPLAVMRKALKAAIKER